MAKLTGKVAVVTGASKGIGAAIARALAAEGASVVVNYASSAAGAEAVVRSITEVGGTALAVQGDVSTADGAKAPIAAAVETFGRLDILVNNSGVYEFAPLEAITEELYRRTFDINVLGPVLTAQAALPHLKEGASIVNISSIVTTVLPPASGIYTATKGALNALTGVFAKELAPRGIRINTVSPGFVVTEGSIAAGIADSEAAAGFIAATPMGRAGQPDDIAGAVVFLASDDARWVTGEDIAASGGAR